MSINLKKNQHFKLVLETTKRVTIDADHYVDHIMKMHKARKMTKLPTGNKLSPKIIARAIAEDQAYRSTILAYKLECQKLDTMITQLVEASVLKIMQHYYDEIPHKTKGEKRQYVYDAFVNALPIWSKLENVVNTADAIIEDIDKASWSAKHIIQIFELSTRPELNM